MPQLTETRVAPLMSSCLSFECQFMIKCLLSLCEGRLLPFETFPSSMLYLNNLKRNLSVSVPVGNPGLLVSSLLYHSCQVTSLAGASGSVTACYARV